MYQPIDPQAFGLQAVTDYFIAARKVVGPLTKSPDGLTTRIPTADDDQSPINFIPPRLLSWLVDLRLLRNVPLAYLVPDEALLPPESIRLFWVDPTWTDRLAEGVFSAGNTNEAERLFTASALVWLRSTVDDALADAGWLGKPMTGMLIRSELVRRWPTMKISAYSKWTEQGPEPQNDPIAVLRAEPISQNIYIAVFADAPKVILIGEPFHGLRFGVEDKNAGKLPKTPPQYYVPSRAADGNPLTQTGADGKPSGIEVDVKLRDTKRRINIGALQDALAHVKGTSDDAVCRIALNLEREPYVQIFNSGIAESDGSKSASDYPSGIRGRRGRTFSLASLTKRQQAAGGNA